MFQNRLNIMRIAGIKIGIDISWLFIAFLLSWSLAEGYFPIKYPNMTEGTYWLMGVIGMIGLFVCILLHELGHALVAKYYKIPTEQITLFLFGGLAEIKKEPESPKIEFFVTIAGPIVSFILAFCMYLITLYGKAHNWHVPVVAVTGYLAWINALIAAFNLIPAFPLDGGRIFRSILWGWKKNLGWATQVAAKFGIAFGSILLFLGIFFMITVSIIGGLWLVIIGLYIRFAAYSSRTQYYVQASLKGEKVHKYMTKDPISVSQDVTVHQFVEDYVYKSLHHLYPVTDSERLVGYISLRQIRDIIREDWNATPIRRVMVPLEQFPTVTPDTSAEDALALMNDAPDSGTLLVVDNGRLVGILTAHNLLKLVSLKLELEGR